MKLETAWRALRLATSLSARLALGLFAAALSLGCAIGRDTAAPHCEPLSAMPPLAKASCARDDPGIRALAARLEATDAALVARVSFDDRAVARNVCAVTAQRAVTNEWAMRRDIQRASDLASVPAGPECLANHRLDFNRRMTMLAALARAKADCGSQDTSSSLSASAREPDFTMTRGHLACIERHVLVLLLPIPGKGALVFGAPEIPQPPRLEAWGTLQRCKREDSALEERVDCVLEYGWELLE